MILLSGGKTGGHIMPLVCIAQQLKDKTLYIGYNGMLEEKICKDRKMDFLGISPKKGKWSTILAGFFYLRKKLKNERIDALISSGGFVSTSAILFAFVSRIPIYLIEENLVMGSANKCFSFISKKVFLSYPIIPMKKKYLLTGLPIRTIDKKVKEKRFDLLIMGGSLGSKILCDIALHLDTSYRICLVSGSYYHKQKYQDNVYEIEYASNIYELMQSSKVIISRSGASTTAEVFALNIPLILIPSEKTKKNHQVVNASYFTKEKAAILVREKDVSQLPTVLQSLLEDQERQYEMKLAQQRLVQINPAKSIIDYIEGKIDYGNV